MQSDQVYYQLYNDFMKPEIRNLEFVLSKGVPVIIYNGQNDLIV